MKRLTYGHRIAFFCFTLLTGIAAVQADIPKLIHYQGKLRDSGGQLITGTVGLRFRLYNSPTASVSVLFDESHLAVGVSNGLFSVLIGGATPGGVPDTALDAAGVYLGVSIDGTAELSPRSALASTPHALRAECAERLVIPGTCIPGATVDSAGNLSSSGGVRVANDADPCTSANAGMIRWNGAYFQGCNGTTWVNLTRPAPTVTNVAPATGGPNGGLTVTVTGTNFQPFASVEFGGASATNVVVASATQLAAVTPAHAIGQVDVTVINPDAQAGTLSNGFTFTDFGQTQSNPGLTCKHILDNGGSNGDGVYWIDPDGGSTVNAFQVYCDMSTDGGGWTLAVGEGNPTNNCSWFSLQAGSVGSQVTCNQTTGANLDCTVDHVCDGTLKLLAPFNFQSVRFTGSVFSSGGTNSPVWDWPDADNRIGTGVGHPCGENATYTRNHDLGSSANEAGWQTWSDYGNVCGGSGGYWHLTQVYLR